MDWFGVVIAILGTYVLVALAILVGGYILTSIAHMKALKALGYDNAWMAWIPFAQQYALADVAAGNQETVMLFGSLSVPAMLYKFWWVLWIVLMFIPIVGRLASWAVLVVFRGNCYVKIYARLDGTSEQEQQVLGYLSGCFAIIAIVKFLASNYSTKQRF